MRDFNSLSKSDWASITPASTEIFKIDRVSLLFFSKCGLAPDAMKSPLEIP